MTVEELRVLFIEDSSQDVDLEEHELRKGGLHFRSIRVETREALRKALSEFKPDLIISDYTLPHLDGLSALQITREVDPEVPFIFVSGTIGEERAIESLKNGATDYVVKDHLNSLVVKVRRALKEAEDRKEHRRLEAELRQAQKMEAMGRMAGGVAHDFNNLLTAMIGFAEMAFGQTQKGSPVHSAIEEVIAAGQRASNLTRQLLAFSRKQVVMPKVLNPNQTVADIEKMLRRVIGEDIQCETTLDPELGNIRADPGQLEQVLMNLVLNSRDAMPHGGRLAIETRNLEIDELLLKRLPEARLGPYVVLLVRDTGLGMNQETQSHLFEPFFTTKEEGKGTGLGLSTVYGIVKQGGGFLTIQSELGHGTTVSVYLPRVGELPETRKRTIFLQPSARGSETILVVEDSDAVRKLILSVLDSGGYKVLVARNGEEAFAQSEEFPGPIHLVLTDIVMPRMGGLELAKLLETRRPEAKIIFTSGYADTGIDLVGFTGRDMAYLQKPFTMAEMTRKIRELLDSGKV